MFQFCIRNLEFVYDIVKINVSGKQTIHLFLYKLDMRFLYTNVHHKFNKLTSKSNKNIDYPLPKETNAQDSIENKEFLKPQPMNKLFRLKENLQSFPILGSVIPNDYRIYSEGTDEDLHVPNVTHILRQTLSLKSRQTLEMWKKGIVAKFGEEYFENLCAGLLNKGKLFHLCIKNTLQADEKVEIFPSIKLAYCSVKPLLDKMTSVKAIESPVTHPMLRYKGIVDCIGCYGNDIYVIEWKTSGKLKTKLVDTYDAPVQIAAYIGAINASHQYPLSIDKGLVIVAYRTGKTASVHLVEKDTLQTAWKEWLRRLEQYYIELNEKREEK